MDNIEDADIVVDLSGGKLAAQEYRKRIKQLQAELNKAKAFENAVFAKYKHILLALCELLDVQVIDDAFQALEKLQAELQKHRRENALLKKD